MTPAKKKRFTEAKRATAEECANCHAHLDYPAEHKYGLYHVSCCFYPKRETYPKAHWCAQWKTQKKTPKE